MISASPLLSDLTKLLKRLESDLLQRIEALPELNTTLQTEWQAARDAERCAETFETWADQVITQAGVHWLLSCVFLRFIEDNQLVDRPWLGGTPESGRLALAQDRHYAYFRAHPLENDRDYLLAAFREAGELPGLQTFFDEAHNPVFRLGISGDAAMALRQFWQQVDPNTGALVHDFTDPAWNTRFLGDLYQDLSEATRKRYALLQTPEFVEEFILDRTLTPAIHEFNFREVRMIDPTCGSGHFLLGGFYRLLAEWQRNEPGHNPVDMAQKALDAVAGVDLNPFAVAISRFRLFVAALQASGVQRLANAHDFKVSVAIGDSLLHGTRFGLTMSQELFDAAESHANTGLAHAYAGEDLTEVQRILGRQYHAVVGNPPYIVVKDAALNAAYRRQYASCHMTYSLGAPFTERFFELALTGTGQSAGYVGLITTNSFMKREFGSKLIEQVLPRLDLTHVVDSSGAWIPGHNKDGTATMILFGRHRGPVGASIRTVMGIRSDPATPADPANGPVWSAIVKQIDVPTSKSDFVSVADIPRSNFAKHPWSISGGGASEVKAAIEASNKRLADLKVDIGRTAVFGEENAWLISGPMSRNPDIEPYLPPLVSGEDCRDWIITENIRAIYPYDEFGGSAIEPKGALRAHFWTYRVPLQARSVFGKQVGQGSEPWYSLLEHYRSRLRTPLSICYGEIATHNHFTIDHGGKVFNRTAPVIKLPVGNSEGEHLGLLGLLNSSVACFWLKQVCFPKDGQGQMWEERFAFNATNVADFPLCAERPLILATQMEALSRQFSAIQPSVLLAGDKLPDRSSLDAARDQAAQLRRQMIATQEELDWHCYRLYGLLPAGVKAEEVEFTSSVDVALGERAFEIVLARRLAAGQDHTNWFERHGSTPKTEIPAQWPEDYRRVVARRIELIERDPTLRLLEQPLYKRRWNSSQWQDLEQDALRIWLLARLEAPTLWIASADQPPRLISTNRLAEEASRDAEFMQIAALYAGHTDFDLPQLVAELVVAEAVPALPVQRYSDTGLRKRAQWQDTWALQRREDAIDASIEVLVPLRKAELMKVVMEAANGTAPDADALKWVDDTLMKEFTLLRKARKANEIGPIPVPPKYQSRDFLKVDFWRLRGGLDVPKERWISYPGCERGADGSLVIAWAGWNHLQQATAVASYYLEMKESEGWEPLRLQPLLAALLELVPWLEQWYNELDPMFSERMGDYYHGFVTEEARALGFTLDDLQAWRPSATVTKRARKKTV